MKIIIKNQELTRERIMSEPTFTSPSKLLTSFSSTVLTFSLLAGCASSPEQPPEIGTETLPATQTEATTASLPEKAEISNDVTEKPKVIDETESTVGSANTDNQQQSAETLSTTASTSSPDVASPTVAAAPIITTESTLSPAATTSESGAATPATSAATSTVPLTRTGNDIGKSYGIWTLKNSSNGFCKLSTPTLQASTSNRDYSSQIWINIEEQRIIVNAFMPLDITHPKSGIQIDNQTLIPFTEKANSTRVVITGDHTATLAAGKQLTIFVNGKDVGKQVLQRNVKLTNMNNAINALKGCGQ